MQFLTSLFGGSENTFITAALALGIVLVLIVLGVWVLKVFFKASSNLGRGRSRRLTLVDSVAIDPRRQLIIVRRDNVEHLIMTGGPQDLIVESNIPVERPSSLQQRRTTPVAAPAPTPAPTPVEAPVELKRAPSRPVTDALDAAQELVINGPTGPRAAMERLRELARPGGKPASLRHTGLMRPVSRMETAAVIPINPDNSDRRGADSAKTSPSTDSNGQAKVGGGRYLEDGVTAEGS